VATESEDSEELILEEETDEEPYVEFDISATPSDSSLELLSQKLSAGEIIIPFYQRKFVWKIEQASKLVESFLMGLPVPQVFFFVNENDVLEVIDGQQRLKSVNYFFEGYFGEPDARGKRTVFRLRGLSERSEYNGKTFQDLPDKDKRRLKNATLRAINIKQLKPSINNDSVFHIFERLNTGGTRLKAQEIRNAVYRGNIVEELRKLNEFKDWREILGVPIPDKSQKDMELLLRLYALFEVWEEYEKPMLAYLNRIMKRDRDFDGTRAKRFKQRFKAACSLINEAVDRPFRPRGVLNAATLEAVMMSILEHPEVTAKELKSRYKKLMSDAGFLSQITGATTDTAVLRARIRKAVSVLAEA
jgi:uncharacterized protein with ParB-like and HNH nuclease domain